MNLVWIIPAVLLVLWSMYSFKRKKPHLVYEAIGILLAIFGAVLFFAVLDPIINPGRFKAHTGRDGMSIQYYLVAVPIPLLVLAMAWFFNKKAQRLKAGASKPSGSA